MFPTLGSFLGRLENHNVPPPALQPRHHHHLPRGPRHRVGFQSTDIFSLFLLQLQTVNMSQEDSPPLGQVVPAHSQPAQHAAPAGPRPSQQAVPACTPTPPRHTGRVGSTPFQDHCILLLQQACFPNMMLLQCLSIHYIIYKMLMNYFEHSNSIYT